MIALLQRVTQASVTIEGETVASISQGLLVFIGVERTDSDSEATRLAERLLNYRVFADESGRMNLNVQQIAGDVLLVPQFTLAADTSQGNRPGFSRAAEPKLGEELFTAVVAAMNAATQPTSGQVVCGQFGADMAVALVNDGPVTFHIKVSS